MFMYIEYALHREQPESHKTNFYLIFNGLTIASYLEEKFNSYFMLYLC